MITIETVNDHLTDTRLTILRDSETSRSRSFTPITEWCISMTPRSDSTAVGSNCTIVTSETTKEKTFYSPDTLPRNLRVGYTYTSQITLT